MHRYNKELLKKENWLLAQRLIMVLFEKDKFGSEIEIFTDDSEFTQWLKKMDS